VRIVITRLCRDDKDGGGTTGCTLFNLADCHWDLDDINHLEKSGDLSGSTDSIFFMPRSEDPPPPPNWCGYADDEGTTCFWDDELLRFGIAWCRVSGIPKLGVINNTQVKIYT
jgi:hypothetical protein